MSNERNRGFFKRGVMLGALAYASHWVRPYTAYEELSIYIYCLWAVTLIGGLSYLKDILSYLPIWFAHRRVMRATGEQGTAHFASKKHLKAAGYLRRKGFYVGLAHQEPMFVEIQSNALIVSPAGGGKGVKNVLPNALKNPMPMIISDVKGANAAVSAKARAKKLGHKVFCINPAKIFEKQIGASACYNPLLIIEQNWADPTRHPYLLDDVRDLAKQLITEPENSGENQFFRNGSRKLISFAIVYLVTRDGKVTLSDALAMISDMTELETSLHLARASGALNGDLSRMAKDMLGKFEDGDRKQLESFREGALQALEAFSPSGALAASTSRSDFSFADLRKGKVSVYIICDPTNAEVYQGWLGLVMKAALKELMRAPDGEPVCFMVDEATNFKVEGLPKLLTSAREFKLRMWIVVQEIEMFTEVYGKAGKDALLSQTEAKIVFGTRSYDTAKYFSDYCGTTSYRETSFQTGRDNRDQITRSVAEKTRPLLLPEEVMGLKHMLVLTDKAPPALVDGVGYNQIWPLQKWAEPNPYFGKKRFKGKIRIRL